MEKDFHKVITVPFDPELRKKHDAIRAGKIIKRRQFVKYLLISITPFILCVVGLWATIAYKNFPWQLSLIAIFGFIPTLFIAIIAGGKMLGKIVDPLDPVEKAFEKLYMALSYDPLDAVSSPPKYDPIVRQHVNKLVRTASFELRQYGTSDILLEQAYDLLETTRDNLTTRILPASEDGNLSYYTMNEIAKTLANPTVEGLVKLNTEIESSYEEGESGSSVIESLSELFRSKPGLIVQCIVYGFGLSFLGAAGLAYVLQQDIGMFFKVNAGAILGGWFVLTVGFLAYLRKS